jgi:hypothetical protein
MFAQSLEQTSGAPVEASGLPEEPGAAPSDTVSGHLDRAMTAQAAALYRSPDGDSAGTLAAESPVRVLARSGDWVRVQAEGWVREENLQVSTPGVLVGVSGAEVRARPSEFRNKLVQWAVEFIAIQSADEVRRDIPEGRQYMLARGPLPETGFMYVMLDEAQLSQMERLEPLQRLLIVGRIRTARSHYLGNPVLTLVEAVPIQP